MSYYIVGEMVVNMPKSEYISISVVKRLPRYYRYLGELSKSGVYRISSRELAQIMKLTASQIRQDLNCFGGFGQQGYGYNVNDLYKEIGKILGIDTGLKTIMIGAGNLGQTIALHMDFEDKGFNLIGIFDRSEKSVGRTVRGVAVGDISDIDAFCKAENPVIAILCIPNDAARELAPRLIELGIKGFWNFSHYDLGVDFENVAIENIHLGDSLMTLCYHTNDLIEAEKTKSQKTK